MLIFTMLLFGVCEHAHQAKVLKYPLNENFVFFIATQFIFIILGATCSVRLMGMGRHPNMLGLKSLQTAKKVIAGIEVMHMIKKGQTPQGEKSVQK
ncbi:transposase domain protein [Bacillus pseudomycoides]|nr:transposase domain protein [Bacillus pseudomycoides]